MKQTQIKRLFQSEKEFVPITLAEAVVVNATDITGLKSLGITTLDKVLSTTLGVIDTNTNDIDLLNTTVQQINNVLKNKQDKLTAGTGINISEDGTISAIIKAELYKIVDILPTAGKQHTNIIYLVPSKKGVNQNNLEEFICIYVDSIRSYVWEQLGSVQTDVDLRGYITQTQLTEELDPIKADISSIKTTLESTISAKEIKTTQGSVVNVDYEIPTTLYDYLDVL